MIELNILRTIGVNTQKLRYWKNRLLGMDHATAYSRAANAGYAERAAELLEDATGGGEKQFEFLVRHGLESSHQLLDLGCGYLRGGQYFIDYLEPGNYTGMDMATEGIEAAKGILEDDLFELNRPEFVQNTDLRFREFEPDAFDCIIAHSVFTHLREPEIRECVENVGHVLTQDGKFFATYFDADEREDLSSTVFAYTKADIDSMLSDTGLTVTFSSPEQYEHEHDQRMMVITRQ